MIGILDFNNLKLDLLNFGLGLNEILKVVFQFNFTFTLYENKKTVLLSQNGLFTIRNTNSF